MYSSSGVIVSLTDASSSRNCSFVLFNTPAQRGQPAPDMSAPAVGLHALSVDASGAVYIFAFDDDVRIDHANSLDELFVGQLHVARAFRATSIAEQVLGGGRPFVAADKAFNIDMLVGTLIAA